MFLEALRVSNTVLAHDPFVVGAVGPSADLARIQFRRNLLNHVLTDGLKQPLQLASGLLVQGNSFA